MLGFTLLRLRGHRALFAAALLTVLLTTCVLATLAAFTDAIGVAGLHRTLAHQESARTTVDVTATVSAADQGAVDRFVRSAGRQAFGTLPSTVRASTRSGPFGLPKATRPAGRAAGTSGGQPDLTLFATFDRARITVVSGRLPGPVGRSTATVPVALPETAARDLGLRVGSRLTLADRLDGPPVRIVVTGTFRPADAAAAYWQIDPLGGRGVATEDFTTYGPLLTDPSAFTSGRLTPAAMSWQATADFTGLTPGGVGALADRVSAALTRIDKHAPDNAAQATSDLPDLLHQLRLTLLTERATLLIDALQLAVLAAVALVLVAGLLAAQYAGQSAVLRARGASTGQLVRLAGAQSLLIAVPSALLAPPLAGPLVRLLGGQGALAATGTRLGGSGTGAAWEVAAATAAACALAVVWPATRHRGTFVGERTAWLRLRALPESVRAGADLALLALAGVAYWQLARGSAGGALSTDTAGTLGVDPVLVTAPALCLLAGTLLVLRLLPLLARAAERRAARGRGLVPALAGWQLARRPRRGAAPALLLVLAVALSMFTIGQNASWHRSQRDQAAFAAGADVRVTASELPQFGQGGVFTALAGGRSGVTSVTPVYRDTLQLAQGRTATVLAMDTTSAAHTMLMRPDLAGEPLAALLRPLHAAEDAPSRRDTGGFVIPANATRLRLTARLDDLGGSLPAASAHESVNVTLKDRYGVAYSFFLGDLPADGRDHTLVADLAAAAGGAAPAGPLRLTGIEDDHAVAPHDALLRFTVAGLATTSADGTTRPVPEPAAADRRWKAQATLGFPGSTAGHNVKPFAGPATSTAAVPLSVTYQIGAQPPPDVGQPPNDGELTLQTAAPPPPPLTAVASDAYLKAAGAHVGGDVQVQLAGAQLDVKITSAVRALPTAGPDGTDAADDLTPGGLGPAGTGDGQADPTGSPDALDQDGGAILLDLTAVNRVLDARHAFAVPPDEWWLATTGPHAAAKVASALVADGDAQTVVTRDRVLAELDADPLGAGPQSALPALVIAAAVLAGVGFAVSALGAVREREGEFALLRALGAPRSRLARMIAAEQGLLALVSLAVGVVLGAVLTRLVVPLVVLTEHATRPVPSLVVELPAGPLLRVIAVVLAVPVLVVVLTAVRRGDPAGTLRRQEED
jgi:hypothetical protein